MLVDTLIVFLVWIFFLVWINSLNSFHILSCEIIKLISFNIFVLLW